MTLHLISLPHTQTTDQYLTCAYTQKVVKFSKMMTKLDYKVILYSGEENSAVCAEHVPLVTEERRAEFFGNGFDTVVTPLSWDPSEPYWAEFNAAAINEIKKRIKPRDLIMIIAGTSQQVIAAAFPNHMSVEWGIGYEGTFAPYRIYESYAWMHYLFGQQNIINGRWFDEVIPNFFDKKDFPVETEKEDYLLYCGRVVERKGIQAALDVAKRTDKKLIIAGPGGISTTKTLFKTAEGTFKGRNFEYVGEVDKQQRGELMSKASALLVPTIYIEPFGGVAVEAMMCGTPVIASDFGAFTETVQNGLSGYRFRTLKEGADAVLRVGDLDPKKIAKYARSRYSLEAVGPLYDTYFKRLDTLWKKGWYT